MIGIRDWYKTTHSVSPQASAADMAEIMEAYWNLSSKRFIDNCCMMTDADLLGDLPARLQDEMYEFLGDDKKMEVNTLFNLRVCLLVLYKIEIYLCFPNNFFLCRHFSWRTLLLRRTNPTRRVCATAS